MLTQNALQQSSYYIFRWIEESSSQSVSYPVEYIEFYEPYVIMSTAHFLPYDERFRGYGLNKCIHLRALSMLKNVEFNVLKDHFVIANTHDRSEAHSDTYGKESGFRKYVVYEIYERCIREMSSGSDLPKVSALTAALLQPNKGSSYHFKFGLSQIKNLPSSVNLRVDFGLSIAAASASSGH